VELTVAKLTKKLPAFVVVNPLVIAYINWSVVCIQMTYKLINTYLAHLKYLRIIF
jgi:hypothetical protein